MNTDPGVSIAAALDRLSVVPRWRMASVALAGVLLAMPLTASRTHLYFGLSYPQIAVVSFIGLLVGWSTFDRLAALRSPVVAGVLVAVAVVIGCLLAAQVLSARGLGPAGSAVAILAVAFIGGGLVRGAIADRRSMASLVAIAAATSWLAYDVARLPYRPLRDIHLYLSAGTTALAGTSPYLAAPVTSIADPEKLPFVYPPLTIPLFELLATVPQVLADAVWISGSIAAVVAALWLLGVRGRWLLVLLAWPAVALGIQVGNVASFTFFLYVLGFRIGAALVLSGVFKLQSTIPALWLVRERRWRSIAIGVGIVAVLALIAVPFAGLHAWPDWVQGLRYFQEGLATFPGIEGRSIAHRFGPIVGSAVAVVAVGYALLGRGRNGLARFGVASVVASPTLYLHGLAPLLPGALFLGPEVLWFFLGLGPWWGYKTAWLAMALAGLALLVARRNDLRLPADLTPSRLDVHPAGRTGQVWPDPGQDGAAPRDAGSDSGGLRVPS